MPRVRVHQHVNPLSPYYRQEPQPVDLARVFGRPDQPLHLDIGCARGRFLLRMAEADADRNFLGVEIREPLVTEANEIAAAAGLKNLAYEFCNAMIWLDRLLADVPDGTLQMVTIQFPDPWFKKKHAKRRMVNAEMVETIARRLTPGTKVFIQTDIEFLADEMARLFEANGGFHSGPIAENPMPIKTERENAVEQKGLPVYRLMFIRKQ